MNHALPEADIPPVDPDDHAPVLPSALVRAGVDPADLPRFGDDSWQMAYLNAKDTAGSVRLNWASFPAGFRANFQRLTWALLNIETPDVILSRPRSTSRPRLTASSVSHMFKAWKKFAEWLPTRYVLRLADVNAAILADYAAVLREEERSRNYAARQLLALTRIWAYSPYLLPEDRIPMPPWDEYGTDDYLTTKRGTKGRNRRVPIHPATMSPLLIWALRFVTDLAPDILAARAERARLLANITTGRQADEDRIISDYFERLHATGQPLPGTSTFSGHGRQLAARSGQARPAISARHLAGTLGVSINAVYVVINRLRPLLRSMPVTSHAALDVEFTGRIDDRPWLGTVDLDQAPALALQLSTACLIVISYLSGMRPEEKRAELRLMQHSTCRSVAESAGEKVSDLD